MSDSLLSGVKAKGVLTVTYLHVFSTAAVFHSQLWVKALPSCLTQSSFFLLPSLSSFPLSDDVPLCQWGGAGGERRNESGSQEAMHLKSPLCHNKTEIDLWFASSPIPFSSKRMQTDGWTDGYTHTHTTHMHARTHTGTYTHSRSVQQELFIRLLDQESGEQSSRCTHAGGSLPCTTVPILQSCSCIKASQSLRHNWRQLVQKTNVSPLQQLWFLDANLLPRCCTYSTRGLLFLSSVTRIKPSSLNPEIKDTLNFWDCARYMHTHFIHKRHILNDISSEFSPSLIVWNIFQGGALSLGSDKCVLVNQRTVSATEPQWPQLQTHKSVVWSKIHISRFLNRPCGENGCPQI